MRTIAAFFLTAVLLCAADAKGPVLTSQVNKSYGTAMAPIKMEVYSDYQCPACRSLHMETISRVLEDLVANHKVYLVHHDFPLPQHAYARVAARYAVAAARINKYKVVEDQLFKMQPQWSLSGSVDGTVAEVLTPAEMAKVRALVKDPVTEESINQDVKKGQEGALVKSTPTVVITYKQKSQVVPAGSYPIFKRYLEDLLTR